MIWSVFPCKVQNSIKFWSSIRNWPPHSENYPYTPTWSIIWYYPTVVNLTWPAGHADTISRDKALWLNNGIGISYVNLLAGALYLWWYWLKVCHQSNKLECSLESRLSSLKEDLNSGRAIIVSGPYLLQLIPMLHRGVIMPWRQGIAQQQDSRPVPLIL